ncbi:transposon Tf2-6 polyprotein [Trichonephila clavipes]|nr:transposon Tf2-6 polyprotein [Trichonephila clavipes]
MEQQIADLLRQNQDLIRTLQIRDDSHSHKVTVQFEKFEENENFDSFIERFKTYLDVQNVPIANRAKVFVSSLSAKLYQLLKNLLAPDIPSDQTLDKLKDALKKHLTPKPLIIPSRHKFLNRKQTEGGSWYCGCVLSHVYPDGSKCPIVFASRTLSGSEEKYSQIDKEALSIVWAVKKFYLYLKGRRFTLIMDHKPLIAIFGSKRGLPVLATTRLLHYALILQSFEFDIIFRKTIEHRNADFLSLLPKTSEEFEVKDDIAIFQMSQIEAFPVTSKELRQEMGKDIELGPLLRALREGKDLQGREAQYTIEDGCIMYRQRVCIPRKFRKNVLEELHAGHLGIIKMKAIARSFIYWKNIDKDIEEATKNCVDCARYKANPPLPKI